MRIREFKVGAGQARLGLLLFAAAALFFSVQISGQEISNLPATPLPIPDRVCHFITGRMNSIVPQAQTRCYTKPGNSPSYFYVYIYSPKKVLEGQMRRAWSTALFQTLEEMGNDNSLDGACSEEPTCYISIADAYTEAHNWHYETSSVKEVESGNRGFSGPSYGDQDSDSWYLSWWRRLVASKHSDSPGSKADATELAESACERYIAALRKKHTETPYCSVMLANDQAIYIALDFWNIATPALTDYTYELPSTVGKTLDNTGYDGQVILRTPWSDTDNGPMRVYTTLPLKGIEFAFEERQSGMRDDLETWSLLKSNFFQTGQIARGRLSNGAKENSRTQNASVLRYLAGPSDTVTLDTTDGAEWMVSRGDFDRCKLSLEGEIQVSTQSMSGNTVRRDGPPTITKQKNGVPCAVPASFIQGW